MEKWIEMYRNGNAVIHRKLNTVIVQTGSKITMKVYKSENEAIFASLGMLLFLEESPDQWFVDE